MGKFKELVENNFVGLGNIYLRGDFKKLSQSLTLSSLININKEVGDYIHRAEDAEENGEIVEVRTLAEKWFTYLIDVDDFIEQYLEEGIIIDDSDRNKEFKRYVNEEKFKIQRYGQEIILNKYEITNMRRNENAWDGQTALESWMDNKDEDTDAELYSFAEANYYNTDFLTELNNKINQSLSEGEEDTNSIIENFIDDKLKKSFIIK